MKKKYSSFFLGLILFLYGAYIFANYYYKLLPELSFLLNNTPMEFLIAIGGLFLFCFSFSVSHGITKFAAVLASLILLILGAFPLLLEFEQVRLILPPFIPTINLTALTLGGMLLFYGIFLVIDSFIMD